MHKDIIGDNIMLNSIELIFRNMLSLRRFIIFGKHFACYYNPNNVLTVANEMCFCDKKHR